MEPVSQRTHLGRSSKAAAQKKLLEVDDEEEEEEDNDDGAASSGAHQCGTPECYRPDVRAHIVYVLTVPACRR